MDGKPVIITELTRQLGLTSRALRYYEQAGLVESLRTEDGKYRSYPPASVERLGQITILRKMQISVRDIRRIYESRDMSVVVEAFVGRIRAIDEEITALSDLRRIVDGFLQTMIRNGITRISALPFLYEEMDRHAREAEDSAPVSVDRLSAVGDRLEQPGKVRLAELPPMRVLTSVLAETGASDPEAFDDWLAVNGADLPPPGDHGRFEYHDDVPQTVLIRRIDGSAVHAAPFAERRLPGGLCAVRGMYLDQDPGAVLRGMIRFFDGNGYFEVDYSNNGNLRHEPLVESVLSTDVQRERVDLWLPVREQVPNAALYRPSGQADHLSPEEIEEANPPLWTKEIPMDRFRPVLNPHYRLTESGEAEYVAHIDKRRLSTEIEVRIPYRVEIEFRSDEASERYSHGSDEGSIRFYHGDRMYGINMENNSESGLSKHAICFHQPVFGDAVVVPEAGRIEPGRYNCLSWTVGEKHFAVVINGETRYCGIRMPYMSTDPRAWESHPIVLGSNGEGKRYFRSVRVSQLRRSIRPKIREGALAVAERKSNRLLPDIHPVVTLHYGENYWFCSCARYVMERLGEPDFDYWLFSGLTGDSLAQIYATDHFRGDGATDCQVGGAERGGFIERVFYTCGYESEFVPEKTVRAGTEQAVRRLIESVDRGVPVIRYHYGWGVFVGYEEFGRTLLHLSGDRQTPERVPVESLFDPPAGFPAPEAGLAEFMGFGWVFMGGRTRSPELRLLYRNAVLDMPRLLSVRADGYRFGGDAFRAWAQDIVDGRFVGMRWEGFDDWAMHKVYVCNLATNGSCRRFLERARAMNPDMVFLDDVIGEYGNLAALWNGTGLPADSGATSLESLGGGFNVTLEALQDKGKREAIAAKIRECADCMDRVRLLVEGFADAMKR